MSRARAAHLAVLLAGCAALAAHSLYFGHLSDDAYISLRYADQWLRGEGLVFNPGERVMGYSNFAWIALLAGLGGLGAPLPGAAQALGFAAATACLGLVWRALRSADGAPWGALAGVTWLAASGPFALWALGGLEGPLFAFCLCLAVICAWSASERDSRAARAGLAAALALAALTRPEGAAYAVPVAAWLLLRGEARGRLRAAAVALAAALACAAGLALFALAYYGDPLPNTYRAKWHPLSLEIVARGLQYSRHYLTIHYGAPLAVVALWAAVVGRRSLRARGWLPVLLLAAFLAYYLRIGGDALVYYRMWAFVQPLLALLLGDAIAELARRRAPEPGLPAHPGRRWRALLAAGLALCLPALVLPNSLRGFEIEYLRADDRRIRSLADVGRALRSAPPDTTFATNVIGALGYESRLRVVDMLGLVDPHVASAPNKPIATPGHESHDGAYVLDREPDLIFVGIPRASGRPLSPGEAFMPSFPSDQDLLAEARFARDYRFGHLELGDGRSVALFVRRGYSGLDSLE